MKTFLMAVVSTVLAVGMASAQSTTAAQQPAAPANSATNQPATNQPATSQAAAGTMPRIAPGSIIPVQLAKTIDAKKAKTGEEVIAKVTADMKSNTGEVLVPKDTKVIGHVTEVQARNKEQKESELAIAFDHTVTKTGEMQMPMSIQAIIAPPSLNSNNTDQTNPSAPSATAAAGMPSPSGRSMGGSAPNTAPNSPAANTMPSDNDNNSASARPQITAKTQGVIGIPNLQLAPAANAAQGSLMSSEKNNVKLEGGTLMLLRVNQ